MTGKGHSLLKQPLFAAVIIGCATAWRSIRVLARKFARHCVSMERFGVLPSNSARLIRGDLRVLLDDGGRRALPKIATFALGR